MNGGRDNPRTAGNAANRGKLRFDLNSPTGELRKPDGHSTPLNKELMINAYEDEAIWPDYSTGHDRTSSGEFFNITDLSAKTKGKKADTVEENFEDPGTLTRNNHRTYNSNNNNPDSNQSGSHNNRRVHGEGKNYNSNNAKTKSITVSDNNYGRHDYEGNRSHDRIPTTTEDYIFTNRGSNIVIISSVIDHERDATTFAELPRFLETINDPSSPHNFSPTKPQSSPGHYDDRVGERLLQRNCDSDTWIVSNSDMQRGYASVTPEGTLRLNKGRSQMRNPTGSMQSHRDNNADDANRNPAQNETSKAQNVGFSASRAITPTTECFPQTVSTDDDCSCPVTSSLVTYMSDPQGGSPPNRAKVKFPQSPPRYKAMYNPKDLQHYRTKRTSKAVVPKQPQLPGQARFLPDVSPAQYDSDNKSTGSNNSNNNINSISINSKSSNKNQGKNHAKKGGPSKVGTGVTGAKNLTPYVPCSSGRGAIVPPGNGPVSGNWAASPTNGPGRVLMGPQNGPPGTTPGAGFPVSTGSNDQTGPLIQWPQPVLQVGFDPRRFSGVIDRNPLGKHGVTCKDACLPCLKAVCRESLPPLIAIICSTLCVFLIVSWSFKCRMEATTKDQCE